MALEPLESSYAYAQGLCGGFDGETTCGKARGHDGPCRLYDPSGSGRWIEKDDVGAEVGRGGPWPPDSSAEATLGGLLGPRPPVVEPARRVQPRPSPIAERPSARARPPSCGALGPTVLQGGPQLICALEVGHGGMHRAGGAEWTAVPGSPRCRSACSEGHTFVAPGCEAAVTCDGCEAGCSLCRRCARCGSDTCPAAPDRDGKADPTVCTALIDGLRSPAHDATAQDCELVGDVAISGRSCPVCAEPAAVELGAIMRVGRRVGRTLYLQAGAWPSDRDVLVGVMDTPELAAAVVRAWNRR